MRESLPISLRVLGQNACFTRQEFKVDRVSYDLITPSAARAIFEAIFWKPEIAWSIEKVELLKPIATQTLTTNEVKDKIPARDVTSAIKTGFTGIFLDPVERRTQRTSRILRDVDYLIHARLVLRDDVDEQQMTKYVQMFYRRASKGQYFHSPYLGMKEFPADFLLVKHRDQAPAPVLTDDRDLGLMLYSTFNGAGDVSPSYFHARIIEGVMKVPVAGTSEIFRC